MRRICQCIQRGGCYHDHKIFFCWSQSMHWLRLMIRKLVMEYSSSDWEFARPVYRPVAIDVVVVLGVLKGCEQKRQHIMSSSGRYVLEICIGNVFCGREITIQSTVLFKMLTHTHTQTRARNISCTYSHTSTHTLTHAHTLTHTLTLAVSKYNSNYLIAV